MQTAQVIACNYGAVSTHGLLSDNMLTPLTQILQPITGLIVTKTLKNYQQQ